MEFKSDVGKIVSFYSFKGGTGRSMALANIACLLATKAVNLPVLMIDWDLEAPGLHRYFEEYIEDSHGSSSKMNEQVSFDDFPGLLDLFL